MTKKRSLHDISCLKNKLTLSVIELRPSEMIVFFQAKKPQKAIIYW
ncbi:hypothetical protein PTD2_01026 [Pseudoalteromonas tunicata D2]|uniref:Uncharacterized protein n=1 Tax=Pseudoalteromonas tunicata D2 TaxID=87626 RepID=A4C3H6_9GAMM|nr:hypothetical protein PTD2_01026 [Pseudoalteromonas tunicata D2]